MAASQCEFENSFQAIRNKKSINVFENGIHKMLYENLFSKQKFLLIGKMSKNEKCKMNGKKERNK